MIEEESIYIPQSEREYAQCISDRMSDMSEEERELRRVTLIYMLRDAERELKASTDMIVKLRKRNEELFKENKDLRTKLMYLQGRVDETVRSWTDLLDVDTDKHPQAVVHSLFDRLQKLTNR